MARRPRAATLHSLVLAALVRGLCARGLRDGALRLEGDAFDPADPDTRNLLNEALGLEPTIEIAALAENAGLNGGVWALRDPGGGQGERIMKLRPRHADGSKSSAFLPEESEHFLNLFQDFPAIDEDPAVVFPTHVLACYGSASAPRLADIIVMRRAPGLTLAILIHELSLSEDGQGAMRELMVVFEKVGRHLADFHVRYGGSQHNDMQQSNILVDAADDHRITFIDLGSTGVPIANSDLRHFNRSLRGLAAVYPDFPFSEDGYAAFERGYYAQHTTAIGLAQEMSSALRVAVPVTVGEDLGLEVVERDGGLFVGRVADGPVARWNLYNPSLQVLSGQKMLEVNGAAGQDGDNSEMLRRIDGRYVVGDHVDVWSGSRGKWFKDGRVMSIDQKVVEVEFNYEGEKSLGKVLTHESFELHLHQGGGLLTLSLERMAPAPSDESCAASGGSADCRVTPTVVD